MPIYEYRCERCGHHFDAWLRSQQSPEPDVCPKCEGSPVKRVPSLFASGGLGKLGGGLSLASDCGPSGST